MLIFVAILYLLVVEHKDLYSLNLKSLADGKHQFEFNLDDKFFAQLEQEELSRGEVSVSISLELSNEIYRFTMSYDGYVFGQCDRCLSELELDVYSERELVVKLGAEYSEEDENLLVIPQKEGVLALDWLMYEDILLALPIQRLHEELSDCDPEVMSYYNNMLVEEEPSAEAEDKADIQYDEDGIDERWAELKKLRKN